MRFLARSLTGVFLMAMTLALLAWAGQMFFAAVQARQEQEQRQRPARERVFAAAVMTVTGGTERPVLTSFGEVRSRRSLEIRASSAGRIVEMAEAFEEGGRVSKGQFLLRIDPTDAQNALARTQADVSEAEAEVRDAERGLLLALDELASADEQAVLREQALSRQKNLKERGVGTESAVETASFAASAARQSVVSQRRALALAEARVDQSLTRISREEINLKEARRTLSETEITAGFTGTLGDVAVVEGGLVSNAERLAQLTDPTALEVAFRVSTSQYARLLDDSGQLIGAAVTARLDVFGLDLGASGIISRESAAVGEGQTGRLLFARLEDAVGFRPGDFVTVEIEEPALQNVARLPAAAVDAASTVLVLGTEDRLESADVRLLRRQGDDVLVRAPQIYGREIVAERSPLLGAGIKVRPIRPDGVVAEPEAPAMLALSDERRARLIAFVEANQRMPQEAKTRILTQLQDEEVPIQMVERIEQRMGG